MRVVELLPKLIQDSGVSSVFCMLGAANVPWVGMGDASRSFRLIKTRHESTAVSAANAHGRVTGGVGVCAVTRGPGFANAINALIGAAQSHSPLMLVVGDSPSLGNIDQRGIDQRRFTELTGAGFHHVAEAEDLEETFWELMRQAKWNGTPQVLSIPDQLFEKEVGSARRRPRVVERLPAPERASIIAAIDALASSKKPIILAGQGAVLAGCGVALQQLADLVGAHLTTSLMANRMFSGHPRNLGVCGSWSPPAALEAIAGADVVLAVGASLNYYTTAERTLFKSAKVIHCEIDMDQFSSASSPELALIGDARQAIADLIEEWTRRSIPPRRVEPWLTAEQISSSVLNADLGHDPVRGLDYRIAYTLIDSKLPPDRIIVTDAGQHFQALVSLIDARDERSWLLSRGHGTIGLGIGAAIGAAAAQAERPVVLLCGDGGFMMGSHDLDAVRINGLNVTIFVINDQQYGSEVKYLTRYGLSHDVARQSLPDIPRLASAFGGIGDVVSTERELGSLSIPLSGLHIVDVRVDPYVSAQIPF